MSRCGSRRTSDDIGTHLGAVARAHQSGQSARVRGCNDLGGLGMAVSVEDTVTAHLNAWNAPDGPDRAQAIAELYSPNVFIGEPAAEHHGHRGMAHAISALQTQLPGTEITRSGPIQTVQDLVT